MRLFGNRSIASATLVFLFAFVAAASFRLLHLHGVLAYLAAILPAVPIFWLFVAVAMPVVRRRYR
ncbi:MAG: hypothetical protein WBC92_15915 [Terracidiphilus sp.]